MCGLGRNHSLWSQSALRILLFWFRSWHCPIFHKHRLLNWVIWIAWKRWSSLGLMCWSRLEIHVTQSLSCCISTATSALICSSTCGPPFPRAQRRRKKGVWRTFTRRWWLTIHWSFWNVWITWFVTRLLILMPRKARQSKRDKIILISENFVIAFNLRRIIWLSKFFSQPKRWTKNFSPISFHKVCFTRCYNFGASRFGCIVDCPQSQPYAFRREIKTSHRLYRRKIFVCISFFWILNFQLRKLYSYKHWKYLECFQLFPRDILNFKSSATVEMLENQLFRVIAKTLNFFEIIFIEFVEEILVLYFTFSSLIPFVSYFYLYYTFLYSTYKLLSDYYKTGPGQVSDALFRRDVDCPINRWVSGTIIFLLYF